MNAASFRTIQVLVYIDWITQVLLACELPFITSGPSFFQENIECNFETVATAPDPVVSVFDKAAQSVVSFQSASHN